MESQDGLVAQLAIPAKLPQRVLGGDYPGLAKPLHCHAIEVLGKLAFVAAG